MKIFYSTDHKIHAPEYELYGGVKTPYPELPDRIEYIARHLTNSGYKLSRPEAFSDNHVLAVHDARYFEFIRAQSSSLTKSNVLYPSYFMTDTYAPITSGTYTAARSAVNVALSGAKFLHTTRTTAYSLCRPPGHHADNHSLGGYCYFNNTAIAAHYLSSHGRVAILDIDYHHGNGTQDIFYDRDDVLYVSLHADPEKAYPYISGYSNEKGRGKGKNFTINIPLASSTNERDYMSALSRALGAIQEFSPDFLLISLGFDTYEKDPIGGLQLSADVYTKIGLKIGALKLPTLLIQEGGYNIEALPELASNFLNAFEKTSSI